MAGRTSSVSAISSVQSGRALPQQLVFRASRHACLHRASYATNRDVCDRILCEVMKPSRVMWSAVVGCHHEEIVALPEIEEGGGSLEAGTRAYSPEYEHGCWPNGR